jgi:hypothetical protein
MRKWIDINEKRPKDGQKVYTFFDFVGIEISEYKNLKGTEDEMFGHNLFFNKKGFLTDDVTQWMPIENDTAPLPKPPPLKMYILILDWVDLGHAINSAAHAGLMGYLEWSDDDYDGIMKKWLNNSFRKVTCKINEKEFEKAKTYGDYIEITELAFNATLVGLVCKPRYLWPRFFKFLKLYGGKE